MSIELSLIVPVYNSEGKILQDFNNKYSTLESFLSEDDFEIIYVFDGDRKSSLRKLTKYVKTKSIDNVNIIYRQENKGKGFSVIEGFVNARGKYIGYNDFGNDTPIRYIKKMYKLISQDESLDAVLPNKYHNDSNLEIGIKRRFISYGYRLFVKLLLGKFLLDPQTGIKLFKGESLKKVLPNLLIKRFAFEVELLIALSSQGFSNWKYIPIDIGIHKDSTVKFWDKFKNDIPRTLYDTFQIAYRKIFRNWFVECTRNIGQNNMVSRYYLRIQSKKRVLITNWKCIRHSKKGGAELVVWELAKRLRKDGFYVRLLTSREKSLPPWEFVDNIEITRIGRNRYTHTFRAAFHYFLFLKNKFDVVIEAVNNAPYFLNLVKGKEKVYVLYHQLTRENWFYESFFPINLLGYLILEPISLIIQALISDRFITVSNSTKRDLMKWGVKDKQINIVSEGISFEPPINIPERKHPFFRVAYLGSLRKMKRPEEVIKGFTLFSKNFSNVELWIMGKGSEKRERYLKELVQDGGIDKNVTFWKGFSDSEKKNLLAKTDVLCVTSVREGWGIVVTEANVMGIPAVVYDVPGLRDSVKDGITGLVCEENTPASLSRNLKLLYLNKKFYKLLQRRAFNWGKTVNFDKTYRQFKTIIET